MRCPVCQSSWTPPDSCQSCGYDPTAQVPQNAFTPGQVLGARYFVDHVAGSGLLGVTLASRDYRHNTRAALTFIHPSLLPTERHRRRFVEVLHRHVDAAPANAVPLVDAGIWKQHAYVAQQWCQGEPLSALLDSRTAGDRPFSVDEVVALIAQITDVLAAGSSTVHGMLHPRAIWILHGRIAVGNWAVAHALPQDALVVRRLLSETDRPYVAPELVRGQPLTARCDVYALGVLAHVLLTLREPADRPQDHLRARAVARPVIDVVLTALSRDPAGRYSTADVFCQALRDAAAVPYSDDERQERTVRVAMHEIIAQHFEEVTAVRRNPLEQPPHRTPTPRPPSDDVIEDVEVLEASELIPLSEVTQSVRLDDVRIEDAPQVGEATQVTLREHPGLTDVDPRLVRAARALEERRHSPAGAKGEAPPADIDPRLARAASKPTPPPEVDEDWRNRIAVEANSDVVISFLAPQTPAGVQGFAGPPRISQEDWMRPHPPRPSRKK